MMESASIKSEKFVYASSSSVYGDEPNLSSRRSYW